MSYMQNMSWMAEPRNVSHDAEAAHHLVVRHTFLDVTDGSVPAGKYRKAHTDSTLFACCSEEGAMGGNISEIETSSEAAFAPAGDYDFSARVTPSSVVSEDLGRPKGEAMASPVMRNTLVVTNTFLSIKGDAPAGKFRKAHTDSLLHASPSDPQFVLVTDSCDLPGVTEVDTPANSPVDDACWGEQTPSSVCALECLRGGFQDCSLDDRVEEFSGASAGVSTTEQASPRDVDLGSNSGPACDVQVHASRDEAMYSSALQAAPQVRSSRDERMPPCAAPVYSSAPQAPGSREEMMPPCAAP
eukprot:CAMPEP_0195142924 /NCGR_PEP_ID=MMETSP0448-20130528/165413_1 /TAXON_ID=66468 /ORGANISM="Heterocapsa triquestra, Strain CCMP 448" /LENGTH=299 /DNA_ID=CAMNT_0040181341 /DNA_START=48 /DNA_END=944 /DNA_ORIENTATION=+